MNSFMYVFFASHVPVQMILGKYIFSYDDEKQCKKYSNKYVSQQKFEKTAIYQELEAVPVIDGEGGTVDPVQQPCLAIIQHPIVHEASDFS